MTNRNPAFANATENEWLSILNLGLLQGELLNADYLRILLGGFYRHAKAVAPGIALYRKPHCSN